jgi:hypothetical protein
MKMVDDRTKEQKQTHNWLIIGTDKCLSGWGEAKGGKSYAVWACRPADRQKVFNWVESRSDMLRVRETVESKYAGRYRPKGKGHCHIYVVDEKHPALN